MKKGFNKTVLIGDGQWISSGGGIIFLVAAMVWPLSVWENGFTGFLGAIGIILGYVGPIMVCSFAEIGEHVLIKETAGESYDILIKKYKIRHPKYRSVFWITLLLGWTGIGWLIAIYQAASEELIDLPDGMVDELNNLAGIRTSHPPVHSEEVQPNNVNETVATDAKPPALPVRLKGTCESCGARYSILLKPGDHAECDHCGSPIGT